MNYKNIILVFFVFLFFFSFGGNVDAAKFYLIGEGSYFGIGQEFNIDIKINTEKVNINAAETKILFPNGVLELLSTEQKPSIFDFWLASPDISNEKGELTFTGGTPNGVSGEALQVLRIRFKTKGAGPAQIAFVDSVVTASDGKGTNVLSSVEGLNINVGVTTIAPKPAPALPTPTSTSVVPTELPEKVTRTPIPSGNLPEEPILKVPLYLDQGKWYGHTGELIVLWDVPSDVSQVAVQIDHSPNENPKNIEEELFTGKTFGPLKEGVWYAHVRFKNNIGWGKTAHYKISLDTTPPLPFEIMIDNEASDNPVPEVKFETNDSLSGMAKYLIFIDGKGPLESESGNMILPIQQPGKHTLTIRALDLAGNSVEDSLNFEILPLPTPIIEFLSRSVSQGDFVFLSGKSISNGFVDVRVLNNNGKEVFAKQADSDVLGNWEITIEESLPVGRYSLYVVARDDRGAISYPTDSEVFRIRAKTVLSVGFIDLGWFEIALIGILLVMAFAGIMQRKREAYQIIAARDIDKLCKLLSDDLVNLKNLILNPQDVSVPQAEANAETFLKKMTETIEKMKKYLAQEVGKIK